MNLQQLCSDLQEGEEKSARQEDDVDAPWLWIPAWNWWYTDDQDNKNYRNNFRVKLTQVKQNIYGFVVKFHVGTKKSTAEAEAERAPDQASKVGGQFLDGYHGIQTWTTVQTHLIPIKYHQYSDDSFCVKVSVSLLQPLDCITECCTTERCPTKIKFEYPRFDGPQTIRIAKKAAHGISLSNRSFEDSGQPSDIWCDMIWTYQMPLNSRPPKKYDPTDFANDILLIYHDIPGFVSGDFCSFSRWIKPFREVNPVVYRPFLSSRRKAMRGLRRFEKCPGEPIFQMENWAQTWRKLLRPRFESCFLIGWNIAVELQDSELACFGPECFFMGLSALLSISWAIS